ncbi:hypothetical protein LCGC14_0995950 [marine sediment metagenome]|uniref:Uncharacterized protein n=1 Tax=marine sediment metagenome TaxID=412755 RepID=A0A0F9N910_9ZZZZ
MKDWDRPEYQEMIKHLTKASDRNREKFYSGYGIDLSDIDLKYLYENVFDKLARLEAENYRLRFYPQAW